jgi:hypothetical protein
MHHVLTFYVQLVIPALQAGGQDFKYPIQKIACVTFLKLMETWNNWIANN